MTTAPDHSALHTGADQARYITLTEAATGADWRPGNAVTILQNGNEIFPAMLEAIRSAQTSIEFVTYVYWSSDIATEFATALAERARAGVKVRLLIDAIGSAVMSSRTVWQLERAGVTVAWFRPVRWPHLTKFNHRTHRKILVIDGQIGFAGGVGIADEWTGAGNSPKHWRETHCRILGPACRDLQASFGQNWHEATRERLQLAAAGPSPAGPVAVHTTSSTAGRGRPTTIERLLFGVLACAHHRLWITTAYFVPNPQISAALISAVRRGVDVRILTNGPLSNHRVTQLAGRATYESLLAAGVQIYEYRSTVLHSKVITADGAWATLGSTNLDDRSLILNDELNIELVDPTLVAQLDQRFEADLARARHIHLNSWAARPWPHRLAESAASLIGHQL